MLKISIAESASKAVTLFLEGQLSGKWVELLQLTSETYLQKGALLTLDLSKVSFSDRGGIALLKNLALRQVAIRNASPLVTAQISTSAQ